jgi:hypothetical protein
MKQRISPGMKHFLAMSAITLAVILLAGCSQAPVHNDQRSCTHDCSIGYTAPVYATPVYTSSVYVSPTIHRRYMSPSLYHPYRGYGRHHGGPGWRVHVGGSVIIR